MGGTTGTGAGRLGSAEGEGGEEGAEIGGVAGEKARMAGGQGSDEDVGDGTLGDGGTATALDVEGPGAVGG